MTGTRLTERDRGDETYPLQLLWRPGTHTHSALLVVNRPPTATRPFNNHDVQELHIVFYPLTDPILLNLLVVCTLANKAFFRIRYHPSAAVALEDQ